MVFGKRSRSCCESAMKGLTTLIAMATFFLSASIVAHAQNPWTARVKPGETPTQSLRTPNAPDFTQWLTIKGVKEGNPVFIRIFKAESELELWMQRGERFTLVKTYPICAWSGTLGPKRKQGDKQAPEGFYSVSQGRLNPNSKYHLSFNLGYPNKFDRSYKRTGDYLMVHGECVSIGCYAMTNPGIEQIYGLVAAALKNGQPRVQVHVFPFRLTAANVDKATEVGSQWMPFWWNLKQGYDLFEATLIPPKVDVCQKAYVFDPLPLASPGTVNWTQNCLKNKKRRAGYSKSRKRAAYSKKH